MPLVPVAGRPPYGPAVSVLTLTRPLPAAPARPLVRAVLPLAVLVLSVLLVWLRTPASASHVVWIEDGRVFLLDQAQHGLGGTLLKPYAGYLQVVPRVLVALATAIGPLPAYPALLAFLCAVVFGAVAVLVLLCSGAVVEWLPARIALALVAPLAPTLPIEVLGTASCLHLVLLWGAFWLLLARPGSVLGGAGAAIAGAVIALSEVQVFLLAPLILVGVRDRRGWWARGGLLAGLLVCTWSSIGTRSGVSEHADVPSILAGWLVNVPLAVFVPVGAPLTSLAPAFLALAPFAAALVVVLVGGTGPQRVAAIGLAALSVLEFGASVYSNAWSQDMATHSVLQPSFARFLAFWYVSDDLTVPSRYGVVPIMCLLALVVLAAAVVQRRRRGVVPVVLLAGLALVAVLGFSATPLRGTTPDWARSVAAARAVCAAPNPPSSAFVDQRPLDWRFRLPCRFLD